MYERADMVATAAINFWADVIFFFSIELLIGTTTGVAKRNYDEIIKRTASQRRIEENIRIG